MNFYTYETIPLKTYFEIIESGDLQRLVLAGEPKEKDIVNAWDKIIVKNNEQNGGYDFIQYVDLLQGYSMALSEYNLIKAHLLKLIALNMEARINIEYDDIFIQDNEIIEFLKSKRYNIDTTDAKAFWQSLADAMNKSESIVTRIKMKVGELSEFNKNQDGEKVSFDELMASLSAMLGFTLPDDITLSRFNEYRKIIKAGSKQKAA